MIKVYSLEDNKINVLHVDDDQNYLEIFKLTFNKLYPQIHIDTVTSATAAIDRLKLQSYNLILSDYKMPVYDGIELLKTLRSEGNLIPFIMLTGLALI